MPAARQRYDCWPGAPRKQQLHRQARVLGAGHSKRWQSLMPPHHTAPASTANRVSTSCRASTMYPRQPPYQPALPHCATDADAIAICVSAAENLYSAAALLCRSIDSLLTAGGCPMLKAALSAGPALVRQLILHLSTAPPGSRVSLWRPIWAGWLAAALSRHILSAGQWGGALAFAREKLPRPLQYLLRLNGMRRCWKWHLQGGGGGALVAVLHEGVLERVLGADALVGVQC